MINLGIFFAGSGVCNINAGAFYVTAQEIDEWNKCVIILMFIFYIRQLLYFKIN